MTETTVPMLVMDRKDALHGFGYLDFGHSILSFDSAQDGELVEPPFDSAQGGELVEPFRVSDFVLRILQYQSRNVRAFFTSLKPSELQAS
jgi:hypothetical protein